MEAVQKLQTLVEEVSQNRDQLQAQLDEETIRCVCVCDSACIYHLERIGNSDCSKFYQC